MKVCRRLKKNILNRQHGMKRLFHSNALWLAIKQKTLKIHNEFHEYLLIIKATKIHADWLTMSGLRISHANSSNQTRWNQNNTYQSLLLIKSRRIVHSVSYISENKKAIWEKLHTAYHDKATKKPKEFDHQVFTGISHFEFRMINMTKQISKFKGPLLIIASGEHSMFMRFCEVI